MKVYILACVLAAASAAPTTYTYSGRTFVPGTTRSNVPSVRTGLINQAEDGEWMVYQNGRWEMGNLNAVHWYMDGPQGQWPPSGTWHRAPNMPWLNDRVGTCNNCPAPPYNWSNDPVFEEGDAPTCYVDNEGRTIVQYTDEIHHNGFHCSHDATDGCTCTSEHPTHAHGGCKELDHLPSADNTNEDITRQILGGDCTESGENLPQYIKVWQGQGWPGRCGWSTSPTYCSIGDHSGNVGSCWQNVKLGYCEIQDDGTACGFSAAQVNAESAQVMSSCNIDQVEVTGPSDSTFAPDLTNGVRGYIVENDS